MNSFIYFSADKLSAFLASGNEMGRRGLSYALWCVIKKDGQNETKLCSIIMYDPFSLTFNVC